MSEPDVIIVGGGTAGAAAAALCAERGLRVHLLERGPLETAGARWVNDVAGAAFDAAGLPRPGAAELAGDALERFHLVAGWGPHRCSAEVADHHEVDMRALVARLQRAAAEAGATLEPGVRVDGLDPHAQRTLHTSRGPLRARLCIVDASGLSGARLLAAPDVPRRDLCTAAQATHELADRAGLEAFYARHHAEPGSAVCFTGVAGGYSIVRVVADHDRVSILTGSVPADGHPAGKKLLEDFVAAQPWIGRRIFGGARAVPIRHARHLLATPQVALLGDSACQVFPAHGSGIGAGLVAARLLADSLADTGSPLRYASQWQRRHGGLFAAYDLFRRFSQSLTIPDVEQLIQHQLMEPTSLAAGLEQTLPGIAPTELPAKMMSLARCGRLGARMAALAPRIAAILTLYRLYPRDPKHLPRWSGTVARVFGESRG